MHIAPRKHTPTEDAPPPFGAGRKLSDIDKATVQRGCCEKACHAVHDHPENPAARPRYGRAHPTGFVEHVGRPDHP
jgi:hypothetical protein